MKKRPLVSVVMITYNHEPFIKQAIEGVLMQEVTFDVELIIADDASPDETEKVVQGFKNHPNHHWIKYTKHGKNKGMMPNFIWALTQTKGEYIALCEGDDYWTDSRKIEKQVAFLANNPDFVLSYHKVSILKGNQINFPSYDHYKSYTSFDLATKARMKTSSIVFKNVLDTFPQEFYRCTNGDTFLISILSLHGKGYYHDNIEPNVYRIHEGGIWSLKSQSHKQTSAINTKYLLYKFHKKKHNDNAIHNYLFRSHIKGLIRISFTPNRSALKKAISTLKLFHICLVNLEFKSLFTLPLEIFKHLNHKEKL